MQFLDGGSLEHHAKHVMHAQALQAAVSVSSTRGVAIGNVFRDANGRIWWDQEEEWEYAHLLTDQHCFDDDWVRFSDGKENVSPHAHEEEHGETSPPNPHISPHANSSSPHQRTTLQPSVAPSPLSRYTNPVLPFPVPGTSPPLTPTPILRPLTGTTIG
jgi:hypothetical protein